MILADKIIEERKKLGWSQEELAEQMNVSRQSVSKWEGAQSIPDINRILQMSQPFGVSTDYLLKDDAVREAVLVEEKAPNSEKIRKLNPVSMEEASAYLELRAKQAPLIALGVSMCIVSAVPVMMLTALSSLSGGNLSENVASATGVAILLVLVSTAVFFFISCGIEGKKYKYLEENEIETAYGVDGMTKEKRASFEGRYTRTIAIGVVLCILSVVPLILSSAVTENEAIETLMAGLLLILVSIAVYLFVLVGNIQGSYDVLLQEGNYTVNKKKNAPIIQRVAVIYWLSATAIYLAVSLPTGSWETSWVLWPVAGILFGVVIIITKMIIRMED